ncbi:hypothetical protein GCM10009809_41640 [Isoptericola hypogeus]|uniref:Uncharacterized protein n=1 Tax=Isoptericola hypogeus TaxID=300179 RepID=A0ABP4W197_9MICO
MVDSRTTTRSEQTLAVYDDLIRPGTIRHVALSQPPGVADDRGAVDRRGPLALTGLTEPYSDDLPRTTSGGT